jgi:hypothetical protein
MGCSELVDNRSQHVPYLDVRQKKRQLKDWISELIDLIQVPISALRDKQIEGAQRALKRYWFSTPEFSPFRHCNASVKAGQQRSGIIPVVNG